MMSSPEDELASILSHYSMPTMPSASSDSLLTQSQYAKVIFHDLLPVYPTDADIWCRYTVTEGVCVRHGDRVALYRVGWTSVHDHVQFEMAPVPSDAQARDKRKEDSEFQVLFQASSLPKDTAEFYQLCYVNVDSCVCGASVPFQFRRPTDDELCEVEEQEGLLVVRSRTAINEDKLRDATNLIEELEKRNLDHEKRIADLNEIKDKLGRRLDELAHIERHEMRLQKDIQVLDSEKTELGLKLGTSEHRIDQLQAMVDTLSGEKASLTSQLRAECCRENNETERLAAQLDNMQQMLDACTQSKEMAAQALHCEQSKVMLLNIEHDKYKFRSSCLEEENAALKEELSRWQQNAVELKTQVEKNLELIAAKTRSYEAFNTVFMAEKAQLEKKLREAVEESQAKDTKIMEQDEQIVRLINRLKEAEDDVRFARDEVNALRESVGTMMSTHRPDPSLERYVEKLHNENVILKHQQQRYENELSTSRRAVGEMEYALGLRYDQIRRERVMGEEAEQQPMEGTRSVTEAECVVQQQSSDEASGGKSDETARPVSLTVVKDLMTNAEQVNSTLQAELGRIESRKTGDVGVVAPPAKSVVTVRGELARMARRSNEAAAAQGARNKATNNTRPSVEIATLTRAKADVELQVAQSTTRQQEARHRLNQISRRLVEIETETKAARADVDALGALNQAEINDLHYLNHRMETLQQQVLREDEFQGMDRESEEVNRLDRMSKRAHDLETYVARSSAQLEFALQLVQVLAAEEEGLQADTASLEKGLERESAKKERLVDKLETIEIQLVQETERQAQVEQQAQVLLDIGRQTFLELQMRELAMGDVEVEDVAGAVQDVECKMPSFEQAYDATGSNPLTMDERDYDDFSLMMDASVKKAEESVRSDGGDHCKADEASGSSDRAFEDLGKGDPADAEDIPAGIEKFVTQTLLASLPEPHGSGEAELQLRLDLAAAEYRKVYMEKLKAERKLKKMKSKCSNAGSCNSSETSLETAPSREFVCPICDVTFPLNEPEPFTRHFEDHLS